MQDDPDVDALEKETQQCDELKAEIKKAISALDADGKKAAQAKLKANNLPASYQKLNDASILQSILDLITE